MKFQTKNLNRNFKANLIFCSFLIVALFITINAAAQENYLRNAIINELPITPSPSDMVTSAVAADFNGDDDMDMAYIVGGDGDLSWYENDGNQNYTQNSILTSDLQLVSQITADDLDMDNDIDIILGGHLSVNTQLRWLSNDGSGNFTLNTISTVIGNSHWEVVDMDGDLDMDILSVQRSNGRIVWYENDGNEIFTENLISTLATNPVMVRAVHMNDDNFIDFVVVSNTENKVIWFENDGSQNFVANIISTTDSGVNSVAVADFEGDGDIDVFTASNNKVTWYKNDGTENFSTVVIANDNTLDNIRLQDLDGDGDLDVLTSLEGIKWFENDNNKNFTKRILLCCTTGLVTPMNTIDIADRDDDGDLDVLTAAVNFNGNPVRGLLWVEIDSMIASTSPTTNQQNIAVNSDITLNFNALIDGATVNPNSIVIYGDQSGKIDGAFSGGGSATIVFNPTNNLLNGEVIHVNITSQVKTVDGFNLLGQHAFDFRTAATPYGFIPTDYTKHQISNSMSMNRTNFPVDMDNDGDIDILSHSGTELLWFKNDGSENFTENSISVSTDDSFLVYAIDLDLDGDMDAISISLNNETTRWFENDGSQNFTEHVLPTIVGGNLLTGMNAADFDGDGDIDIFINFVLTGEAILYENDGNENFTINTGDDLVGGFSGHVVDMDLDGDMDILSTRNANNLVWYENDSKLSGISHPIGILSENISSVYPVDMDADGDIDIVAGTHTALIWYENDGTQNFTQSLIKPGSYEFGSIDAMDMDGDMDIDIVVASGTAGDTLYWYTNDGSQNFTENFINTLDGNTSVFAVDMDNDGDMDVLSNARDSNEVSWYEFIYTEFIFKNGFEPPVN